MPDVRQIIVLLVSVLVPISLLFINNHRLLLIWLSLVLCINIFDTTIGINLFSARLFGLLLLPITLKHLRSVIRSSSGLSLFLLFSYTLLLGYVFGFLFPWPSGVFERAFNQTAHGRAAIYSIRLISDFSLVIFLRIVLISNNGMSRIVKYLIFGTSIAALGGLIQKFSGVDIYYQITGLSYDFSELGRIRGFNYEPRGLGLIMTYGINLLLIQYIARPRFLWLVLMLIHGLVFIFATSTSSLIVLILTSIVLILLHIRQKGFIARFSIILIIVALSTAIFNYSERKGWSNWLENIGQRISIEHKGAIIPQNSFENIIFHLEYFDGPAVLFLANNPIYIIFGTGPGLIPLPASSYLPALELYDDMRVSGLHYPPTIGLLLEIANAGLIGILFWFSFWFFSIRAFNHLIARSDTPETMILSRNAFIIMGIIYSLQVPAASAIWTVFLSMGLIAEGEDNNCDQSHHQENSVVEATIL